MARSYHLSPRSLKSLALSDALSDPLSARLPRRWPRRRPARPARSLPACSRSGPPAPATACFVALPSPCSFPLDPRRSWLPELLPGRPSFPADAAMVNSMRSAAPAPGRRGRYWLAAAPATCPSLVNWLIGAGFKRAEWRVAEEIRAEFHGREVSDNPFLAKNSTSQLVLLSDEAYAAGLARIHAALATAEAQGRGWIDTRRGARPCAPTGTVRRRRPRTDRHARTERPRAARQSRYP
jgi:hypothetical protein